MKRTMRTMAVLTVLGLMLAGPAVYAEQEGNGAEGKQGYQHGEGKDFFKDLDLTPEQKAQLKAQREAKKESRTAAREAMKTKMKALHEVIAKPETKRADVDPLVNEIAALKAQMFAQKIDGLFEMKTVLTPEQFAKMAAKHQERMEKKGQHGGWDKSN